MTSRRRLEMKTQTLVSAITLLLVGSLVSATSALAGTTVSQGVQTQATPAAAPDLSGPWTFKATDSSGRTVATGTVTVEGTYDTFPGSGTDRRGNPFDLTGSFSQTDRHVAGTLSVTSQATGDQTHSLKGASNIAGTRMHWTLVETAGNHINRKTYVRLLHAQ
jgi:hypothetical protein